MSQCPVIDAPVAPIKGMRIFTLGRREYGTDRGPVSNLWPLGTCYTLSQVNGRSFYHYADGVTGRRLVVEWRQWLSELQCDHHVWLLESETSSMGWRLLRPLQSDPAAGVAAMTTVQDGLDRLERDQRFQRAVQQVARHYRLDRHDDEDGSIVVAVQGGARPYEVRVLPDWSEPPACSCPDAIHRRPLHGGFCKHTVAVLLRWPDLRCQLLSAIL